MLSKSQQSLSICRRIRQRSEFDRVLCIKCLANKWFAIHVLKNEGGISRLGVIASKRIMPKAVSRNFAKRLIRDVFRRGFAANSALDVVVRIRRQLSQETSKEGRLALTQLLQATQK